MRTGRIGRAVVGASLLAVVLAGCDWTAFRGGAARTGYNGGENGVTTGNAACLQSAFTIPLLSPGGAPASWNSNPVVVSNRVYVVTTDSQHDFVQRWDLAHGTNDWSTDVGPSVAPTGSNHFPAAVTVSGDYVYAATVTDASHITVTSLAAATGASAWTTTLPGLQIAGSPIVDGNKLFVATTDGLLYAFDPATGQTSWSATGHVFQAPAAANGVVYVGDAVTQRLVAFNESDGSSVAGWPAGIGTGGGEVAVAGTKVVSRHADALVALNASTGTLAWSPHGAGGVITSVTTAPAVANNKVYFGTSDGHLHIVDLQTGAELSDLGNVDASKSVSVTDNVLYTVGNNWHAVNPATGAFLATFNQPTLGVSGLEMVPANNYVLYSSGGTYALKPPAPGATCP